MDKQNNKNIFETASSIVTIPRSEYNELMYAKFVYENNRAELLCRLKDPERAKYVLTEEKILYRISESEVE